jgi:hypothetical protein
LTLTLKTFYFYKKISAEGGVVKEKGASLRLTNWLNVLLNCVLKIKYEQGQRWPGLILFNFIVFWKTIAFDEGSLKRAPMALTCP